MGFLKFLKKEKKEDSFHELDLPPAPPSLEGFEDDAQKLSDFQDIDDKPQSEDDMPKFDFDIPEDDKKMPEFPSFPELDDVHGIIPPVTAPPMQPSSKIPPQLPEMEQEEPEVHDIPAKPKGLFREEGDLLDKKQDFGQLIKRGRTIYVRVDKFKSALGNINMIRNDLKKSEDALMKLENMKNAEYKSFDTMKSSIEDLQKKFIFVDKTLFKGD